MLYNFIVKIWSITDKNSLQFNSLNNQYLLISKYEVNAFIINS